MVDAMLIKTHEDSTNGSCAPWYLRRLELENIRGFERLELDFGPKGGPIRKQTVIIGRNGTCKTTLLRTIALGLASRKEFPELFAAPGGRWLSPGEEEGSVHLHLEHIAGREEVRELVFLGNEELEGAAFIEDDPFSDNAPSFLCAYGVGRGQLGGAQGRGYRVTDAVATLFQDERLVSSELVLRRLYDFLGEERYDVLLVSLQRALGLSPDHRIELPRGGGVEIRQPELDESIPLEAWADGYRMTFSWLIDFYGWAMQADAFDDDGNVQGILLVDELEQHLHPAMQRELLPRLAEALPKVQVIATTHSPLVALSARPEQIVSLRRDGSRVRSVHVPTLDGYSVEDALVEEALFGTEPYSPETERRLERHLELSRVPPEDRSPEEVAELRELAGKLDPSLLPGLRDDPVLNRLDEIKTLLASTGGPEGADG